jgi:hypothetical protein
VDVIWWGVPIIGCVALAACIAAALLPPRRDRPEQLRALANTHRLTGLPEYVRAARLHTITAGAAVALLVLAFVVTAFAAGRPTGLPAPHRDTAADQPEDIMVCAGGPATDPTVAATLRYFAETVRGLGTERVGLTSANRRLVPLTRDHEYAAGRFARLGSEALVAPVAYTDYEAGVEDVLAMCLTGFPDFDTTTAQRRSVIYVGGGTLGDDEQPALFTAQRVRDLAVNAGVQVNAITDDEQSFPADLARETGGRVHPAGGDVTAYLREIRGHPPQPRRDSEQATSPAGETPDLLLLTGLGAVLALLGWPLVVRR